MCGASNSEENGVGGSKIILFLTILEQIVCFDTQNSVL